MSSQKPDGNDQSSACDHGNIIIHRAGKQEGITDPTCNGSTCINMFFQDIRGLPCHNIP